MSPAPCLGAAVLLPEACNESCVGYAPAQSALATPWSHSPQPERFGSPISTRDSPAVLNERQPSAELTHTESNSLIRSPWDEDEFVGDEAEDFAVEEPPRQQRVPPKSPFQESGIAEVADSVQSLEARVRGRCAPASLLCSVALIAEGLPEDQTCPS